MLVRNFFSKCIMLNCVQAVEFFAEWALRPSNTAFLRVQTGVYDPLLIGDKPRWYSRSLNHVKFTVFDENASTLETAIIIASDIKQQVDNPTGKLALERLANEMQALA